MQKIHGELTIQINHNIMEITAIGPWNMEFFDMLHRELIRSFQQLQQCPYATLLTPVAETLAVSEAVDYHIQFLKQAKTTAVAIVLSESEFASSTQRLCHDVYRRAGLTHAFFDDTDSARQWLQQQLQQANDN